MCVREIERGAGDGEGESERETGDKNGEKLEFIFLFFRRPLYFLPKYSLSFFPFFFPRYRRDDDNSSNTKIKVLFHISFYN